MIVYTQQELKIIKEELVKFQHLSKIEAFHKVMETLPPNRRKHARYSYEISRELSNWILKEKISFKKISSHISWGKEMDQRIIEKMIDLLKLKEKNSYLLHNAFLEAQESLVPNQMKPYISVYSFIQGKYSFSSFFKDHSEDVNKPLVYDPKNVKIEGKGEVKTVQHVIDMAPIPDDTFVQIRPKAWDDRDYSKFIESFLSLKRANGSFLECSMGAQHCLASDKRKIIIPYLIRSNKELKDRLKEEGISIDDKDYRQYKIPSWSVEERIAVANRTMQLLKSTSKDSFSSFEMQDAFMVSQKSVLRSNRYRLDRLFSSFLQVDFRTNVGAFLGKMRANSLYVKSLKKEFKKETIDKSIGELKDKHRNLLIDFDSKTFAKSVVEDIRDILQPKIQEIINDVLNEIKNSLRHELTSSLEQKLVFDKVSKTSSEVLENSESYQKKETRETKRKILILGPWAKFQRQVDLKLYPNLDVRFFDELKGVRQAMQPEPKEVTLLQATKFSAHLPKDIKTKIGDIRLMAGSISQLRNHLQAINATVRDANNVNT